MERGDEVPFLWVVDNPQKGEVLHRLIEYILGPINFLDPFRIQIPCSSDAESIVGEMVVFKFLVPFFFFSDAAIKFINNQSGRTIS